MQKYKILAGELFGDAEQKNSLGKEGDVVTLEGMTEEFINTCVENNIVEVVADEEEKESEEEIEEPAEEPAASQVNSTDTPAPKKYYRNSEVLSEEPRTVGAQTFQHIKTVEGHEFDLTHEEYSKDITVQ